MLSSNHLEPNKLILIGASTGGPGHIQKIVRSLPINMDATIVIAQHIGDDFIPSFVNQLKQISTLEVSAATNNESVLSGRIYICSLLTEIRLTSRGLVFRQVESHNGRYNPDIDSLFQSVSKLPLRHCPVMSVVLTGVGDDGAKGSLALSGAGATCIAECEKTAVVYGMPLQAKLMVDNISVQCLDEIIRSINSFGKH